MEKDKMMRIVISDAVRKGIRNIKTDPHRSIRNLVDLGNHFSTGRFQQTFFENTQQLLMDPQSPYYDLIYRTVSNVDDDTLTRIGVNVGYMSWTFGAAKIRRIAQSDGYVVPWTLLIDMKGACSAPLDIERMIKEGQHQGIYTYMFFLSDDIDETAALLKIFARYPESAFIVFSDFDAVSDFLAHDTFTLKKYCDINRFESIRPPGLYRLPH
jgi:hypothetical protein